MHPGSDHNVPKPVAEAWRLCRPHLAVALTFSAFINLLYLAPTLYMLQVYDRVVQSGSSATLLLLTLILTGALVLTVLLDRLRQRLLLLAGVRLDRIFSLRIFRARMARPAAGGRLTPVMREFDALRGAVTGQVILTLFDTPWTVIYIAVLFLVHWSLGALAIFASLILLLLAIFNEQISRRYFDRFAVVQSETSAIMDDIGRGAAAARSLGMSSALIDRLEQSRERTNAPQIDAADANAGVSGLIRFLRLFFQSAALGLGAWLVIHKLASPGAIFAGSMLMSRALSPVDQAVAQWRTVQLAVTAYRNLRALIAFAPAPQHTALELASSPRLDVEGLSVLTPSRDQFILRGVTFTGSGSGGGVIGVIGPSGAGKTTLLECLANARPPDQGEVRLDGARLADWDPDRLGPRTGFLPQDILLFPGTVKQNIARFRLAEAGKTEALDHAVIAAAKRAGAHQMILTLPEGYDTEIEGRALRLSAGQAQQIGLARAFFGDPSFLVLDEPNAHLDPDAERSLFSAIRAFKDTGALILVTGHRMPMPEIADALIVIRGGRLESFGPTQKVLQSLRQLGPSGPRPTEIAAG